MSDEDLTDEQKRLANHGQGLFAEACPGAGKTRSMVARVAKISRHTAPRIGIAVLSFTNSAIEDFREKCSLSGLADILRFPNFVGTFDHFVRHFLFLPGGIDGLSIRPMVVDSWKSLEIQVRLTRGNRFRGNGVYLDSFDPTDNHIVFESIGHSALRTHAHQHKAAYIRAAIQYRQGLRGKGYLSTADARVETLKRIRVESWSAHLGRALASRFREVIVDEAQDCNPHDLEILAWLKAHGIPVTVVCDPDQAIYGFRYGNPADLAEFSAQYGPENQLRLTGNFRSSPPICALAATLRTRSHPDDALGSNATVNHPVHVIEYEGRSVPFTVGHRFRQILESSGLDPRRSIILAHKRNSALRASGQESRSAKNGESRVEIMAMAVGEFACHSTTGRRRENILRTIEKMILRLMGKIEDAELPSRAVERQKIDARWLRRLAFDLVTRLPKSCSDTTESRNIWLETLRAEVQRLGLTYADGLSVASYFRRPLPSSTWASHLNRPDNADLYCSTIHEAKGREYEAVCVVIPPDSTGLTFTSELFRTWEERINAESKRVIYVGITRAQKLVALAIPHAFRSRLAAIVEGAGIGYALHEIVSATRTSSRLGRPRAG
jgi:DNA helicase-2/ATP-dependent DNA helicase PcrA